MSVSIDNALDFWIHVQEPSTRVQDHALLARLAWESLQKFDDILIQAAALTVLMYRSIEDDFHIKLSHDELDRRASAIQTTLLRSDDFDSGRWFLSLCLARSVIHLSTGNKHAATQALKDVEPLHDIAHSHGQLYTNIVKATLVRAGIGHMLGYEPGELEALESFITRILGHAGSLPSHYKFSNQYAFEEVAFVYTMLRQLYNWQHIAQQGEAAFKWNCVRPPFDTLIAALKQRQQAVFSRPATEALW